MALCEMASARLVIRFCPISKKSFTLSPNHLEMSCHRPLRIGWIRLHSAPNAPTIRSSPFCHSCLMPSMNPCQSPSNSAAKVLNIVEMFCSARSIRLLIFSQAACAPARIASPCRSQKAWMAVAMLVMIVWILVIVLSMNPLIASQKRCALAVMLAPCWSHAAWMAAVTAWMIPWIKVIAVWIAAWMVC